MEHTATFRFYEELNDFLPEHRKKSSFSFGFTGHPSVKDSIESLGVPHTEVDLILVNGESVSFSYRLEAEDTISVFPVFESFDISGIARLRERPLRDPRFILDVHLGKLARFLRMLGFDSLYRNDYDDPEIAEIAGREGRIVLTRDRGLLKRKIITRGYCVRSRNAAEQVKETVKRFQLRDMVDLFRRCISCNGVIEPADKADVLDLLPPRTREYYDRFYRCRACGKIYWQGSHYIKMRGFIENLF